MDLIELKRIVTGKNKKQKVVLEVIQVKDIKNFRPWYKSDSDTFDGEATLIVLYDKSKGSAHDEKDEDKEDGKDEPKSSNLPTMLINESYESLLKRMSGRVIIIGK